MLVFAVFLLCCVTAQQITVNVTTTDGPIQGIPASSFGFPVPVLAFLGIPYAAAPTGTNRWKAPQPNTPWTAVRPTMYWGAQCINASGKPLQGSEYPPGITWDEDCLNLDVYVPDSSTVNKSVLVWFHGGGLNDGGSATVKHHGFVLAASQDIIVVLINYRLGLFGFLALPQLMAEDPNFPSSGNYGFFDQIAALEWVKNNAAAFGGNPEDITIGGESSGAATVSYHMASERSMTSFSKAIMLSPPTLFHQISFTQSWANANASLAALLPGIPNWQTTCTDGSDPVRYLACLRAIPATTLPLASPPYSFVAIDGYAFNESVFVSFNAGRYSKVPVLASNVRDEGTVFLYTSATPMNETEYVHYLSASLKFPDSLIPAVMDFYGPCGGDCRKPASAVFGDSGIICPGQITAQMISAISSNLYYFVWAYTTSYTPAPLGAYHTVDQPYWFGTAAGYYPVPANPFEKQLATNMSFFLGAFVKGLELNTTNGLPLDWPLYSFPNRSALSLASDGNWTIVNNFADDHCYLWKVVFPQSYASTQPGFAYVFPEPFTFRASNAFSFVPTLLLLCFSMLFGLLY